jgi:ABC-2 type transport system ATP-binding protein
MPDVIRCQGLGKRYGSTVAVDSLDLTVEAGQIFGFLGRNGAGKPVTGLWTTSRVTMPAAGVRPRP